MIALDDNIEDHPKFVGLSNDAFALWLRCIGYCRRNRTDGFVPAAAATARARCSKPLKAIAELLKAAPGCANPLWHETAGGYQIHDYTVWNPTRKQVEERIEKNREKGQRGGFASGQSRAAAKSAAEPEVEPEPKPTATKDEATGFDVGSTQTNPVSVSVSVSVSDPKEERETASPPKPKSKATRAESKTACPDPDDEGVDEWLSRNSIPSLASESGIEVEKFLNHHRSKGNRWSSWKATWGTWTLNWDKYQPHAVGPAARHRGPEGVLPPLKIRAPEPVFRNPPPNIPQPKTPEEAERVLLGLLANGAP